MLYYPFRILRCYICLNPTTIPMNAENTYRQYSQKLSDAYPTQEAKSLVFILLSEGFGISRTDLMMRREVEIDQERLEGWIDRLVQEEPIQHILGKAWFAGLELKVTPDTLIPRPETEELVAWIASKERHRQQPIIVDIGTGSGCIPLALKRRMPQAMAHGLDISDKALAIAWENQQSTGLEAHFYQTDVLAQPLPIDQVDVLVSNPPYVRPSEKSLMSQNVLGHEPHSALFIPEEDPLLFYRRIAALGKSHLVPGGALYFEINEAYGEQALTLLHELGYVATELRKDLQGKDRMVRAEPRSCPSGAEENNSENPS